MQSAEKTLRSPKSKTTSIGPGLVFLLASIPFPKALAAPYTLALLPSPYRALRTSSVFLAGRQTPGLSALALPECALPCFITALTSDECASETDFACHCQSGRMIASAETCVADACGQNDKREAMKKVSGACRSIGVNFGDDSENGDREETMTAGRAVPTASTSFPSITTTITSSTFLSSLPTSRSLPSPTPSLAADDANPRPQPTETPLTLLPPSRQLSPGAKAGISVSISLLFVSLLISLLLYIRSLKRELRAAQRAAAAGANSDDHAASYGSTPAPAPVVPRRPSWAASPGRRKLSPAERWSHTGPDANDDDAPISPLSPRAMEEIRRQGMGGGANFLPALLSPESGGLGGKKARKRVLSVVVEESDTESTRTMMRRSPGTGVREPVPGQREGLAGPLELDGEGTGIVELPVSVTPRGGVWRGRGRGKSARGVVLDYMWNGNSLVQ